MKYRNLRKLGLVLLQLLLIALSGCTVTKGNGDNKDTATDDTDSATVPMDSESESDSVGAPRGPAGIKLTGVEGSKAEFPVMNDEDGPVKDDTRASLRAIEEADIVQVVGNRLYTLSKSSGLSVIDVTTPDTLGLLGNHSLEADPFEMYVRGDRMIVLLRNVQFRNEDNVYTGVGSRIATYNVANPQAITLEKTVDVEGVVFDSRIVDNSLFVVTYKEVDSYEYYYGGYDEDESEVDTANMPAPETTVISFNVTDATNITEVQRLMFPEVQMTWRDLGWSKKSITITDDRLYVAGPSDGEKSLIQVVDISNPAGTMTLGAQVEVSGAIFNRWQIDEYNGILRVVSQPPDEGYEKPPVVQTYTIVSSTEITPLGTLTVVLPEAELLRAVRFDEDKAYLITFKKLDPLFVIDLSDPSVPVQAGELEMPGFVFHLEPRGDRLIGLGFDPDNIEGGDLHVSLFDVSNKATPTLLSRVYFGPEWESVYYFSESAIGRTLTEDQNRIHKQFKVLDDLGLILVPFSGWGSEYAGCGRFESGVQLVSFTSDALTKHGLIGDSGTVRRALIHNERMLTFSDDKVQTFNIDNLDAPTRTAAMPLTLRVHRTAVVGDKLLRITSQWDQRIAYADLVPLADAAKKEMGPTINLASVLTTDEQSCGYHNDALFMDAPLFVFGNYVAMTVVRPADSEDEEYNVTDLIVLDTTGDAPTLAARLTLDFEAINTGLGKGIVQVGNALIFQRPGDSINEAGDMQNLALEVVDMSNPATPALVANGVAKDFAVGTTGLHVTGTTTSSGFFSYDAEGYLNYYLDRTDFAAPAAPESLPPVAFPGLVLGPLGTDYLGIDFEWTFVQGQTESACIAEGGEFDFMQNVCWYPSRAFKQVTVTDGAATVGTTLVLNNQAQIRAMYTGAERYFLPALNLNNEDASYYSSSDYGPQMMVVVGTSATGISVNYVDAGWGYTPRSVVVQNDVMYYLNEGYIGRVTAPTVETAVVEQQNLGNVAYHLTIQGDNAIVSLGDAGVTVLPLANLWNN